jgi:hypothetical protein
MSAAAGELGCQADASGVGGHAALKAGGDGRGGKPESYHLRRERHDAVGRLGTHGVAQRGDGARGRFLGVRRRPICLMRAAGAVGEMRDV